MNSIYQSTAAKMAALPIAPEEKAAMGQFWWAYQKRINRLTRAATSSNSHRMRSMAASVLRSHAAKLSAVVRTVHPDEADSITLAELSDRAGNLNPRLAQAEPVLARLKRKPGGGVRPIVGFGPARRAYQLICRDIIKAGMPPCRFEFLAPGRGADHMVRQIASALQSGVGDHVVTADIQNCFGSIQQKEVLTELLPLPGWAVRVIITVSDQTRVGVRICPAEPCFPIDEAARQGLPQGASTSGLILSRAILGPILATTSFADRLFLYGDNITVIARSKAEGEQILGTLRSVLQDTPVGPLVIGEHSIRSTREKVELVKYALLPIPDRYGSGFRIIPAPKSYRRFEERMKERAVAGEPPDQIRYYTRRWIAAFPLWCPNDVSRSYLRMYATLAWLKGESARWQL